MRLYISTAGIKKVTISNSGAGAGKGAVAAAASNRRVSSKAVLLFFLLLAILLPFVFVRIAFLVLESASVCDSPLDCIGLRILGGSDSSLKLRDELVRALLEQKDGDSNGEGIDGSSDSFDDLIKEVAKQQDIRAFASKTKAMLNRMERKVRSARLQELLYWHLASHGIPKSIHCLCIRLTEEYSMNAKARSHLPSPEYVSRLTDPSFHHVVLMTDNVLAAAVVISSAIRSAIKPETLVFHIVTDKKTYTPMHAWFAVNSPASPVVEVKGLHQYDWSQEVNVGVKEMLEIHRLVWKHHYKDLKENDFRIEWQSKRHLQALSPSCLSLLNHLRMYTHELFPDLDRIVFLDDDVVVQHDISSLWELDLNDKVVGAVVGSWCGENCCPGRKYRDYLNFSNPLISSSFHQDRCAWLSGMNVFDLEAWRRSNITRVYHEWLRLNLNSGLELWQPGYLPPALLAFEGLVHPLDPLWHMAGLGDRNPEANREVLDSAAVLHFSGPAKPWLEIADAEVQSLWYRHVNSTNSFIRKCRI